MLGFSPNDFIVGGDLFGGDLFEEDLLGGDLLGGDFFYSFGEV